jgi:Ca2+-binding EF-hand superfamily protein
MSTYIIQVQTMVKEGMESLDVEHKGYITREEYVGKLARHVGVEHATAVYNAMDTDSKGKIEHDDLFRAKLFYYTDLSDEANPLNLMQGPLE